MNCERCGKDISWSSYTIAIPVELGYEHNKVCFECFSLWNDRLRQVFDNFVKEGEKK